MICNAYHTNRHNVHIQQLSVMRCLLWYMKRWTINRRKLVIQQFYETKR